MMILVCIYFSFLMTVLVSLTVFNSYFIYYSLLVCFYSTSLFTVVLKGRNTYCCLLTTFISHLVFYLKRFLSSACTWQYLWRCIASGRLLTVHPDLQAPVAQQARVLALLQKVPSWWLHAPPHPVD